MHAQVNAVGNAELDPKRRKSLSASARPGAAQTVPAWLVEERAAAGRASSPKTVVDLHSQYAAAQQQLAEPKRAEAPDSSRPPVDVNGESQISQVVGQHDPEARQVVTAGPEDGNMGPSLGDLQGAALDSTGSVTGVGGNAGQSIGSTPFSAFTQHSGRTPSSSDDCEGEHSGLKDLGTDPPGSFTRRRSGPFGGRGVALGHMMAAQQQWRQDSFSKAQVCQLLNSALFLIYCWPSEILKSLQCLKLMGTWNCYKVQGCRVVLHLHKVELRYNEK